MSLQSIAQGLRGTRDKTFNEIADALREITSAFSNTYRDMGWFAINEKSSGLRKDAIESPLFRVIGGNKNDISIAEIRSLDGKFVILLDASQTQGIINIESRNPAVGESMQLTPNTINITDIDGQLLCAISASQDALGSDSTLIIGQSDNGDSNSFSIESNPAWARIVNTYKDPTGGDTITSLQSEESAGTLSVKKGPDNEVNVAVDAAAVVVTISDIAHNTTLKPESVATPRLAVGTTAPATDGHAVVATFLGTGGATAPSAGESLRVGGNGRVNGNLGIGMNPARALDITGDVKATGSLEIDGAAQFDSTVTITPLASGEVLVGQTAGTLSTVSPAAARFLLDVYTKAEVDAAIAAAISAIVVDNALVGTPEEHSHSLS